MLIKPFLIVVIVMLTCCTYDSSVINLTYSEQQSFLIILCLHTDFFINFLNKFFINFLCMIFVTTAKESSFSQVGYSFKAAREGFP